MEDDPEDVFDIVSVGPLFKYVVPSFNFLAVELCSIRIAGQDRTSRDVISGVYSLLSLHCDCTSYLCSRSINFSTYFYEEGLR